MQYVFAPSLEEDGIPFVYTYVYAKDHEAVHMGPCLINEVYVTIYIYFKSLREYDGAVDST